MNLLNEIKQPIGKQKVEMLAGLVANGNMPIAELIDLSFYKNEQIGFRAAWILENIFSLYPEKLTDNLPYFLSRFSAQQNLSAQRHFVKIVAKLTHKRGSQWAKSYINNYQTDELVATVFSWLVDEHTPVAVKSRCLNILADLIPKHEWIKEELVQTMNYLVDKESIAFFAKVKQIRKQLKKF